MVRLCGVWFGCVVKGLFAMVRDLMVWCCDVSQVVVCCRGVRDGSRRGGMVF